jgi:hypothetical protein
MINPGNQTRGSLGADNNEPSLDAAIPNVENRTAIDELKQGKGERFDSVGTLMIDLESED